MAVETELISISDDVFEKLMETPKSTPSAEDLIGAKQNEKETKSKDDEGKSDEGKQLQDDIIVDDDLINALTEEPVKDDKKVEDKSKKEVVEKAETKVEAKTETTPTEEELDISHTYKAISELLIKEGIWQDFDLEGIEDFNSDIFAQISTQQAIDNATAMFDEMVDQTGQYGKAIIDFIKSGGNPSDVIDLFKEEKRLSTLDISSEENQEEVLKQYYDSLGWNKQRVTRQIGLLKDSGALASEAKDAKIELENAVKAQVEERKRTQEEMMKQQEMLERQFSTNVEKTLKERSDLSVKDRENIRKSLLEYNVELPNGKVVNQFYVDFMKMQQNLDDYVDLVLFVKDKTRFVEKISKKEETKATKKTWDFIKRNGSVSSKSGGYTQASSGNKTDLRIDYKNIK